ncbi:hypothetical protein ACIBF6_29915 [Streptosporangium amethystogenes]|uniref:hypothetical protein n=1 Tax=Streptosporangium amethystogenes TaxID=2002 RepID=UPI0037B74100
MSTDPPTRAADMFADPGNDPRTDTPARVDEHATPAAFLRRRRDTLELKCSGLDAADLARHSVEPSTARTRGMGRTSPGWVASHRVSAGGEVAAGGRFSSTG